MVGKRVFDELYVHLSAMAECEATQSVSPHLLAKLPALQLEGESPNVIKFNLNSGRFSLLLYRDFDASPFPELAASWAFTGPTGEETPVLRRYDSSLNPPILHRKELLVAEGHPGRASWCALTSQAETLGLFDDTSTIGFKLNWERLIAAKGYQLVHGQLVPLGNELGTGSAASVPNQEFGLSRGHVQRHLTALQRSALSAPVQLLLRHQLLVPGVSFFDYGCGRGSDIAGLLAEGYDARGWDPFYAPEHPRLTADVVNLGFVVNVIEDPAERAEALHQAFKLARRVLIVSVMLYGHDAGGLPFSDGVLTSRRTFQKYFAQSELKEYVEQALGQAATMVGPGMAIVFADPEWEQRFQARRYRRQGLVERLLTESRLRPARPPKPRRPVFEGPPRPNAKQSLLAQQTPALNTIWARTLDLGRWPEGEEATDLQMAVNVLGSWARAKRLLAVHYDMKALAAAARQRTDDLTLYFGTQLFSKRRAYRELEPGVQRDVKAFFGDFRSAQAAALRLLKDAASPSQLFDACARAAEEGLGYLDGQHSLQLHISLLDRLPVLLRAYVGCGLILWDATSEVQLIKIHIGSGKLTLMEFADGEFDSSPLPRLKRRIKVNIRKLDCDVFEYGSAEFPMPLLYRKSRYLHEESPQYAEQQAFDEALEATGLIGDTEYGPPAIELAQALELRRLCIQGLRLTRSERIPDLDQPCGANFTYRSFIECGETQQRLGLRNIPLRPETYNALYDLSTQILDPVIEYFGAIRLTYGFCGPELGKHIHARVAPKLDQHASWERNRAGKLICERGGAACDFIVDDEDMKEVADWLLANTPVDRLYFYGAGSPVHVSFGPERGGKAVAMRLSDKGNLMPRRYA